MPRSYDLSYTYDAGGNRLTKSGTVGTNGPEIEVVYHYDLEAPETYLTKNNRLQWYETYEDEVLVETVWYHYDLEGRVTRIARQEPASNVVEGIRLDYDKGGRVWRAIGDTWVRTIERWYDTGMSTCRGYSIYVGLTKEAMTHDEAEALAESLDGVLAPVPAGGESDPTQILDWYVATFAPTNGVETRYWVGGHQVEDCSGFGCWEGEEDCDKPAFCWAWWWPECPEWPEWELWWFPTEEMYCADYPSDCDHPLIDCALGQGWLAAEPDDGVGDCTEAGRQDQMELVFNRGGNADSNGFADAGTNGVERRALIARSERECAVDQYERLWALEFRYDGGRERYLTRRLDPDTLEPTEEIWSDYDHSSVYGDYTVSGTSVTERVRYMPGSWQQDASTNAVEYVFGDQIGTTRVMLIGTNGPATRRAVYTAFGELIEVTGDGRTRYGYAGAWGYQEHDADTNGIPDNLVFASPNAGLPFLHVGWRFYDPGTGRFLQRDPIGIRGGLNVYGYVANNPLSSADAEGLWPSPPQEVNPWFPKPSRVWPKPKPKKPKQKPNWKVARRVGGVGCFWGVLWTKAAPFQVGAAAAGGWETGELLVDLTPIQDWIGAVILPIYPAIPPGVRPPAPPGPVRPPKPWFPRTCFVGGTKVLTPDGFVTIERVDSAAQVVTNHRDAPPHVCGNVSTNSSGWTTTLICITVEGETICCTGEHPFWVIGKGWVKARRLRPRDSLLNVNGEEVPILRVEYHQLSEPVRVYNITVEGTHTYFIGESKLLVHNKSI